MWRHYGSPHSLDSFNKDTWHDLENGGDDYVQYIFHIPPHSKATIQNFSLSLSLSLNTYDRNPLKHFNILFSKSKHEDSRANQGDSKLVRRFGSDFKQVPSKNKPHITIFYQKPI
ncbi:hypothetical protein Hanom_Chr16g01457091 [Helianthus anomalus]